MPAYRTITFDNITTQPSDPIPDGYQGFAWVAYDPYRQVYGGDVNVTRGGRALTSGDYTVLGLGFQMRLKGPGTFDLKSAVLAAGNDGFNMDVTVVGRLSTTEKYRKQFNILSGFGPGPTDVTIDCNGVDEVVFYGSAIEVFDVDNIVVASRRRGCYLLCDLFKRLFGR
jgi:hypothetical protein